MVHAAVAISRATGVDVITGSLLDGALDAVIDVTNTAETDPEAAQRFFETVTSHTVG
jgi:hypothetical protein